MIKTVLFDMDGVLIDAKDWHYDALNRALEPFGMPIDRDAHLATFDGLPTRAKLKMLSNTRGLPLKLHKFINDQKQRFTTEIAYARCRPVFHHRAALSRLKQEAFRTAVCSNSIRRTVNLLMDLSGLAPFLDLQISNEDVAKSKPDPEMYLHAMQSLSAEPSETLILEDNDHGIEAARRAGAHVLVVGSTEDVTYNRIRAELDVLNGAPGLSPV